MGKFKTSPKKVCKAKEQKNLLQEFGTTGRIAPPRLVNAMLNTHTKLSLLLLLIIVDHLVIKLVIDFNIF